MPAARRSRTGISRRKRQGRPATGTGFRVNECRAAVSRSGLAVSAGGPTRSRPRSSIQAPFRGPMAAWPGVSLAGQVLYELHTGTFTSAGTWTAATAELAELARLGITVDRGDADRRVRRAASGGATTASTCSRRRTCTARPDDFRAFVDRAHAAGHRRHPRRRLQPPRSGRQLSADVLAGLLHRSLRERVGRRDQFRRPRRRRRSASSSSRTPATGSTSSTSTACGSMRRSRSSTARRAHVMAAIGDRVRERAARPAARSSSPRTSRRTPVWSGRRPRAATASTRSGTTTFITARWWR